MAALRGGLAAALLLVCLAFVCQGEETAAAVAFGRPIITSFSGKLYDFVGRPDVFFDLVSCESHQVGVTQCGRAGLSIADGRCHTVSRPV